MVAGSSFSAGHPQVRIQGRVAANGDRCRRSQAHRALGTIERVHVPVHGGHYLHDVLAGAILPMAFIAFRRLRQ